MSKDVLILDFNDQILSTGIFSPNGLVHYLKLPIKQDINETLNLLSNELIITGYKCFLDVIVGLPQKDVSLRTIELPFTEKNKLRDVLPFEAGDLFVKKVDELVLDALSVGSTTFVGAIEKIILKQYIERLNFIEIDPSWIGLSLLSKNFLLRKINLNIESKALIDSESVTVVKDGEPCLFKVLKGPDDLRLAFALLDDNGVHISQIYASYGGLTFIRELGIEANVIETYDDEKAGLFALWEDYKSGSENYLNFRYGEFAGTKDIEKAIKDLKLMANLLTVFIAICGAYFFLKHSFTKSELKELKSGIERSYRELFPEDKIIDPNNQLETKLKMLKAEKKVIDDSVNAQEIMLKFSEAALGAEIRLYQLNITTERVTAKLETSSFEQANSFKDSVAKLGYFKDIIITDSKKNISEDVSFSLLCLRGNS